MKPIIPIATLALISLSAPSGFAADPPTVTVDVKGATRLACKTAPELGETAADIVLAESRLAEAKGYRFPKIEFLSLTGPAPQARREQFTELVTGYNSFPLTVFTRADATVTQPLWTFGKIDESMKAATHGIAVDEAKREQKKSEIGRTVREYYNGILLARESKELLQEALDTLKSAREKAQKLIEQQSENADEADLYKLDTFTGAVEKYVEEAKKGERLALAALRTRLGLPEGAPLEIADERLRPEEGNVGGLETYVAEAKEKRPEFRQIAEGVKARTALVEAARGSYYPDIFLGMKVSGAYSPGRDIVRNPYITDDFNHFYGGVGLGIKWNIDFGITGAKVANEQAQLTRLMSTKEYAEANIPLQVTKAYLELKEAERGSEAMKSAYTNAKRWLAVAVANYDFGIGPAKEIFDALQSYVKMRSDYFQSIYNYNLAKANLEYAAGNVPEECR